MRARRSRRSRLYRRSSPAGIKQRMEQRVLGYLAVPADLMKGFRRPGSRNPRKYSR